MKANIARLFVLVLLGAASAAPAQTIVASEESLVDSRLLVGARQPDGTRDAGLELTVREGWKTYWRSPGGVGVPPSFDWSRSTNLAGVEIAWPAPDVFESFGLRTVGYSGSVVLPLRLTPEDPARPIGLALDLTLGVCREICVFQEAALMRVIEPEAAAPAAERIETARAARPASGSEAGLQQVQCRISGTGEDREFRASLRFDRPLSDPYVALEAPETAWFHDTTVSHDGGTVEVASTLSLASASAWIDRSSLRMTVLDSALAAEVQGCRTG